MTIGMTVGVILCLIFMSVFALVLVLKLALLERKDKLTFIKDFKKGKFAIIYLVAIPLFWIGCCYQGEGVGLGLYNAVTNSIKLIVLEYNYAEISNLLNDSALYNATMIICYILVVLNAIFFIAALFWQRFGNYMRKQKALGWGLVNEHNKIRFDNFVKKLFKLQDKTAQSTKAQPTKPQNARKYFVIVGYNENNVSIIDSIDKTAYYVFLACPASDEVAEFVYNNKISHLPLCDKTSLGDLLKKTFVRFEDKEVKVIINSGDDTQNLMYVEQMHAVIKTQNLSLCSIDNQFGLYAYVFGEAENTSTFLRFVKGTNGCVQCINRHNLMAIDFVDKYPLTQYMTEQHIDYKTATIKPEVDVNVVMLGFGKSNQQLFLTSVANNQFLQIQDGKLCQKVVKYHIYDKRDAKNDKNLNHNYARFENEFLNQLSTADVEKYLDFPNSPANSTDEMFHNLDINDTDFYNTIRKQLSPKEGRLSYNYIIIAAGDDLENLDLTEKITAKLAEWGLASSATTTTKVFVKIKNDNLCTEVVDKDFAKENGCEKFITYGNQNATAYNVANIIGERFAVMARGKHLSYQTVDILDSKEHEEKKYTETEIKRKAWKNWYDNDEVQRLSNIYACMSIRMKLHLLGFDYAPKSAQAQCQNQSFMDKYQEGDPIAYDTTKDLVDGKQIFDRSAPFVEGSLRQTYAIQEHQRWNAYMITCGFIPATKEQIFVKKHKDFEIRYHGNLTTFDGLKEYAYVRAIGALCDLKTENFVNASKEQQAAILQKAKDIANGYDVIKYDYDLMDDLVWLLDKHDYKIVKK